MPLGQRLDTPLRMKVTIRSTGDDEECGGSGRRVVFIYGGDNIDIRRNSGCRTFHREDFRLVGVVDLGMGRWRREVNEEVFEIFGRRARMTVEPTCRPLTGQVPTLGQQRCHLRVIEFWSLALVVGRIHAFQHALMRMNQLYHLRRNVRSCWLGFRTDDVRNEKKREHQEAHVSAHYSGIMHPEVRKSKFVGANRASTSTITKRDTFILGDYPTSIHKSCCAQFRQPDAPVVPALVVPALG